MRRLRKWMFAGMVLLLLGVLTIGVSAATVAEGTCGADGDNLTWVLDDTGTLTISGTGAMKNYSRHTDVPWNTYDSDIIEVVFTDTVTSIGKYAFYNCDRLTQIVLPDSLSSIGNYAFYNCNGLTQIVLPDSLSSIGDYAFYNCNGLAQIVLPDSLSSIGDSTFYGCYELTDIVFPDSLSSIGNSAFEDCSMLTKACFNGNAPEMGSDVFAYTHEDFTIYYNPNTTGWSSSEWNGYPAYPYGDTNCDTEITDTDALYLLRHTLLPERYPLRGAWFDFNNDGIVNFRDAVYLLRHVLMPDDYPLYR